jgi:hypothetical protein
MCTCVYANSHSLFFLSQGYHPLIVDEAHPHHPDFQGHPWQQLGNATITTGHVAAAEKAPAVPVPLGAH